MIGKGCLRQVVVLPTLTPTPCLAAELLRTSTDASPAQPAYDWYMLGVALLCEVLKSSGWKERLMSAETGRVSRTQVAAEVERLKPPSLKALVQSIFARAQ